MTIVNFLVLVLSLVYTTTAFAQGAYKFNGREYKLQNMSGSHFHESIDYQDMLGDIDDNAKVDLRARQSMVKDQGSRGSCAYFAATGLVEDALMQYLGTSEDINISEEYLIYLNKAVHGMAKYGDGSSVPGNLWSLQQGGFLLEEDMPYTHSWFNKGLPCENYKDEDSATPAYCYSHYGPSAQQLKNLIGADAITMRVANISNSNSSLVVNLINSLRNGVTATIAVLVNPNGWDAETGVVMHNQELQNECRQKPDFCGGHAILLVGFDRAQRVFIFKNSWGNDWGEEGYGTMSFEFVNNWSYARSSGMTAKFISAPKNIRNRKIEYGVDLSSVSYKLDKNYYRDGERGILLEMSYRFFGPAGSWSYVSVFPQIKTPDGQPEYSPIEHNGKYVADRYYHIAFKNEDFTIKPESPIELFIPYSKLQTTIDDGKEIYLRPSIYKNTDTSTYQPIFREYIALSDL